MGADNSVVAKVEVPALAPLNLKSRLADTPTRPPIYAVTVKNAAGQEVTLADPRATRALVALMNVHAVNGGAACHWGGPAAFAGDLLVEGELDHAVGDLVGALLGRAQALAA